MKQLQQITITLKLKEQQELMTDVMSVMQDTEKIDRINHIDFYNLKNILRKITLHIDRTQHIKFWGENKQPLTIDSAEYSSLKKLYFRNQLHFTQHQRNITRHVILMLDAEQNKSQYVLSC